MKKLLGKGFSVVIGLLILFSTLTSTVSSADGSLTPRWVPDKPAHTEIMEDQSRKIIEVKFVEGSGFRLMGGEIGSISGDSLIGIQSVLAVYAVETIEPLFTQSETELQHEKTTLESETGEEMPDLNLWFRFRVGSGIDPEGLIDALNALQEVEIAYPAPLPAPPPSSGADIYSQDDPPATPNFVFLQGYLKPAPGGIDARHTWHLPGGKGQNVSIVDIEYDFKATHEDLPTIPIIGGQLWSGYGNDHGTAVLGELAAKNNSYGATGIAYASVVKFSSACMNRFTQSCDYNLPNAINTAKTNTVRGDVILVEQQTSVCGGAGTGWYGPVEWTQSVYDAIKFATAAGRIVVEAAGNGGGDLDHSTCKNLFNRATRDSGAIIVGAGAPPNHFQTDRSRLGISSYGSRVDLQGWGVNVVTTGYGDLYGPTPKREYTKYFSGTSSASAMVAGAAAILSSINQANGHVPTPNAIRLALIKTGSVQQASTWFPISQHIGPRPNLKMAAAKFAEPKPITPSGVITDRTPTYVWTKVTGATNYQFQLRRGTTVIYNKYANSGVCGSTICSKTPTNILGYNDYKWRARAKVGGIWQPWSAYISFRVTRSGFSSTFNRNKIGWKTVNGTWAIYNSMYLRTLGVSSKIASSYYNYDWTKLKYEVRMKRFTCSRCATGLYVRGTPLPTATNGHWDKGYWFAYANDGYYKIYRIYSGRLTPLMPWTSREAGIGSR